ncbi:MAG TPA: acylphosphatase [Methylococcaceae bacterium]|nr:acylphosphatase [Methylococcaceae bacterium]
MYISGRVQGVFFRVSAQKKANLYGITGWVKNCADGRVEIVASGETTAMTRFLSWCHQGPNSAQVDHVSTQPLTETIFASHFKIR